MLRQSILLLTLVWTLTLSLAAAEPDPQVETVQLGVRLTLVAEHPDLATPTGIDVDDEGRVWVVATHTHMRPDDYNGPTHDEILVFDTRQQESPARRVFYNATTATMDLELGPDGWIYLAERDRILRIKDTDGDGAADVEENLVVLTSEADYPHNGLSGLAWDPGGSLVFGLGENFAKPWTLAGTDRATIRGAAQGGVFRCTADGKELHWIARGLWNPFGICVRDDGEMFAAENDPGERPPCRLLHIVDGGEYGYRRQYGPEAHHPFVCWNGELPGTLPMVHPTGEAPCGVLPLGRGLLVPSWGDHRIDFLSLRQRGASYGADLITIVKGGRYFRPTCIARDHNFSGNKRVWYLADWVDGRYNAHGLGRLWKLQIDLEQASWVGPLDLEPPTHAAQLAADLRSGRTSRDTKTLRELAGSEDPFLARAALVALGRDAADWTPDDVRQWPKEDRAEAVMALNLANASPDKWLKTFLTDESADVQYQALRWIANAGLKQFLPEVEAVLNRRDIDYSLFEAAMAAWNTLKGKPEAGLRDVDILLARVRDDNSAPRVRAFSLRLLPVQSRAAGDVGRLPARKFPNGLSLDLLRDLLAVDDTELSLEVIRAAAGNPGVARTLLSEIAVDVDRPATLRAEAVAGLAAVSSEYGQMLLELADDRHRAVREEALRCLRFGSQSAEQTDVLRRLAERHPESADLITAILDPESLKAGRPAPTDSKAWRQHLDTVEGPADVESGRRIFHHARLGTCSHCHRHSGRGNVVGPDLSSLGNRATRDWLLMSILDPSREMAPEYQPRTLVLKDGRTFTGIRLRSYTREQIRDAHGQTRTFDRGEVESITDSNVSFMPKGLIDTLTIRELRDLVAFLGRGNGNKPAQNKVGRRRTAYHGR
ncbi:MAG: c-type cytochrome [Pirellulaceae bacterium]|nr:c-type cytochrome [Pirellulaceae bacterium]